MARIDPNKLALEERVVQINRVAKVEKGTLNLQIGFSTPVLMAIPKGITVEAPNPTTLDVKGIDRQQVGEFSARIRATRKPEPYKGKGVRYAGEQIRRKAGKAGKIGGKK